jgi:polysaccharide pyruvyl transferase WcaK-like protein
MRILVEPSDYTLFNIGDTAMLQVAVRRLSVLFPNASIQVFTDDPAGLAFYCPTAIPLNTRGRRTWLADGYLFNHLYHVLSNGRVTTPLRELEKGFRRRLPSLAKFIIRLKRKYQGIGSEDLNDYLRAVSKADLVVVSGMGGITDTFQDYAFGVLDTLELAIRSGIPTAMLGQGIGPLRNPKLKARAKAILPHVNFISLRESRTGAPLLASLGVSSDRVLTTGDDAIELAYRSHSDQVGRGLGVNLRAASYSEVDRYLIEQLRPILQDAARRHQAAMITVPISRVPGEEDVVTIRQLMTGYPYILDNAEDLDTQPKVIEQVRRCRIIVAGSYHAAVFALAQGIPTVGLANSDYYFAKFFGLADQFGTGCEVISLSDAQLPKKLALAIDRAWESAESIKPQLLKAAAQQVELSRAAYQRIYEMVLSCRVAMEKDK